MLQKDNLKGSIVYFDGQQDDARMCLTIGLTGKKVPVLSAKASENIRSLFILLISPFTPLPPRLSLSLHGPSPLSLPPLSLFHFHPPFHSLSLFHPFLPLGLPSSAARFGAALANHVEVLSLTKSEPDKCSCEGITRITGRVKHARTCDAQR